MIRLGFDFLSIASGLRLRNYGLDPTLVSPGAIRRFQRFEPMAWPTTAD